MQISERVIALATHSEGRYASRTTIRQTRARAAEVGNLWGVDDPERVSKRLAHVQVVERRVASVATAAPSAVEAEFANDLVMKTARERTIGKDDLVAPQFLRLALAASRCVCRVTVRGPSGQLLGYGTGTLVGPGILLTNNHVLESPQDALQSEVTFGYETAASSTVVERVFRLQPERLFITDVDLDFTFVAVSTTDTRGGTIVDLGYITLNGEEGKAINREFVTVIQHPNGGPKMFAVRENRIVDVLTNHLHYVADTAPGSSGAPVFNDQFEVVALHHSGVPARDANQRILNRKGVPWTPQDGEAEVQWVANEGVRVSVIAQRARNVAASLGHADLLSKAFDLSRSVPLLEVSAARTTSTSVQPVTAADVVNGVATWTIPLSVSVSLGAMATDGAPSGIVTAPPIGGVPGSTQAGGASPLGSDSDAASLSRAVARAKEAFRGVPGVALVRAGWQFSDGWITDKRAVVVLVDEKKTTATLREEGIPKLPVTFEGYPVDVRQASAEELYELQRIGSGLAFQERTPNPTYKKPPHLSLPRVRESMRLKVHVSPEHGWPALKEFLDGTTRTLTVAMYDFGAPHIIKAVKDMHAASNVKTRLIIQYGASVGEGTKANDLNDTDTVDELQQALGNDFAMQWANVAQSKSLWASSYHIKVAVRDSSAFWLSSGNWQSSNQPDDSPPKSTDDARQLLTDYNREWHVVVENPTLSGIFESYIKYDIEQSAGFVPKGVADAFEMMPVVSEPEVAEVTREIRVFKPLELERVVDVQPILTPDNYVQVVLPLIERATSRLYFQNQYINESLDARASEAFIPMIRAIAAKQRQGLDVRLILRGDHGVEARHIEFMKTHGVDMSRVRWRKHTHTKGIIVDSARVLLGSHNWSFDGTVLNRDASLLFDDSQIAKYLEEVFIYDWENWSSRTVSIRQKKPQVIEVATAQELAALRQVVASKPVVVRRLFRPDDD